MADAETLEDRMMAWMKQSIAERGGTARRLSRFQWEMPPPHPTNEELARAIKTLLLTGRAKLDVVDWIGFVYLVPLE